MESQSSLSVAYVQNPAVMEANSNKKVGDSCTLEVKATIKELNPNGVVYNIEAVVPEGYEVAKDTEEEPVAAPLVTSVGTADETIPTAIASMVRKKA